MHPNSVRLRIEDMLHCLVFPLVLTWIVHGTFPQKVHASWFHVGLSASIWLCWQSIWHWNPFDNLYTKRTKNPTFWIIDSLRELCAYSWCSHAQTPLPCREVHVQFCLISVPTTGPVLTQGGSGWWSPACQGLLLASSMFTPLTELSDFCPQTKWAHRRIFLLPDWRAVLQITCRNSSSQWLWTSNGQRRGLLFICSSSDS